MLTVITGAPCAGKSTYARQYAMAGDIIIDFDAIAQALGSPVSHGHDHHIAETAAAAWSAAIERAIEWHGRGHRAWIVDTSPTDFRRRRYERAGARIVTVTADRAELHRRADAERPTSWHAQIDQFLDKADPAPLARTAWLRWPPRRSSSPAPCSTAPPSRPPPSSPPPW
jgi:uncharacterized protein